VAFASPLWLLALLAVAALAVAGWRRRGRSPGVAYSVAGDAAAVAGGGWGRARRLPDALLLTALALGVVALARPQAEVLAVDINPEALRLTRINAALAGADNLRTQHSDLLSAVNGEFDLILANPPYLIDADQRAYRHGGGPLGAGLSLAILDAALQRLAPGGTLLLYTGVAMLDNQDPFLAEVRRRLQGGAFSWTYREVDPDVFGEELLGGAYIKCDRIAAVVLEVTRPAN